MGPTITLVSSPFSGANEHAASQWQFTNGWDSGRMTAELTIITKPVSGVMQLCGWRVRHQDSTDLSEYFRIRFCTASGDSSHSFDLVSCS